MKLLKLSIIATLLAGCGAKEQKKEPVTCIDATIKAHKTGLETGRLESVLYIQKFENDVYNRIASGKGKEPRKLTLKRIDTFKISHFVMSKLYDSFRNHTDTLTP